MGTNFYLVKRCSCGEAELEKVHLGKCSAGWSFHFRGYHNFHIADYQPPNTEKVESIKEWVDMIEQNTLSIEDEYGKEEEDQQAFIQWAINKPGKLHALCDEGRYPPTKYGDNKMIDGHSFTFEEFS